MPKYQVAVINRPEKWKPECDDDVPLKLMGSVEVLAEADDLFAAVNQAVEHNQSPQSAEKGRWAVVVEPGSVGQHWPAARICTPLTYKVIAIWWPMGWEPNSPLDVPNCVHQSQENPAGEWLTYPQAEATVMALNRQCMDHPGDTWHVVAAVENEPLSRTVCSNSAGEETTTEVRCMHVVRPPRGGRGDCTHCPADQSPCIDADVANQPLTLTIRRSRPFGSTVKS